VVGWLVGVVVVLRGCFVVGLRDLVVRLLGLVARMLGSGARLGVIIHHTDNEREVAYDRKSSVGRLDKALDEAAIRDWLVVSMKSDWALIFRK
jgi:hypothetical protein